LSKYWIIGDIGGTSSRLALLSLPQNKFNQLKIYKNQDFSNLQEILSIFLKEIGHLDELSLFLALAGPVLAGEVKITNLNWTVKAKDLKKVFPFQRIIMVNDLYALAGSIFQLSKGDILEIKKGKNLKPYPKAFLAVGTGLGIAFLLSKNPLKILASEGGHTPFPAQSREEFEFLENLSHRGLKGTYEEVLSGRALANWYFFYSKERLTPEEISTKAKNGDPLALKVIEKIFSILGRICYEIAVTLQPFGGIYLGGGVLQNLKNFFEDPYFKQRFLEEFYFTEKLRTLLERIPIYLILHPFPGLLGAQTILRSQLKK
jgi:glucokinase